jgi:hypothetical protein
MAYDRYIEPIGDRRGDIQAALIAMLIANANRDTKRRAEPYELTDFLLDFDAAEKSAQPLDWRVLKEKWKQFAESMQSAPAKPEPRIVLTDSP